MIHKIMLKIKKFLYSYRLPLLSGFLIGTSYIPFYPWAVFFCYIPLWLFTLQKKQLKPILIGAWLCQFITTLIGFNWVAYTIREFGFFPWPMAIIGLLLFASFANLQMPLSLTLWFISQKKLKNYLPKPLIYCLLPIYFSLGIKYYPMIFKWHLGYTWLYAKWPATQTAEIWGFQFLHTLTLFFNLAFLYLFKTFIEKKPNIYTFLLSYFCKKNKQKNRHIKDKKTASVVLISTILFFISINFYGWYLKSQWPKPDKITKVLIVQPNIENLKTSYHKIKQDPRSAAFSQLIKETEKYFLNHQDKLDFILWPEGAYPYRISYNKKMAFPNKAQKVARKWKTPIVFSTTGETEKNITNSIFVFNEKGDMVKPPYNKMILLAFGEYLPGEKWLPMDKLFSYYGRSFQPGTGENKVIKLNNLNLGFQICYESLFDFLTRDLALKKAQVLINVTNDSWYGSWQQPWQHLYMTLARAIEVRRPLIRGTNTGLSAFISATGEVKNISNLNTQTHWMQKIPYYSQQKQSTFTSWGYYINFYFLFGSLMGVFIYAYFQKLSKLKKLRRSKKL